MQVIEEEKDCHSVPDLQIAPMHNEEVKSALSSDEELVVEG